MLAQSPTFGLGRTPTSDQIKILDIGVTPDGRGLPPGSGTAEAGKRVYESRCIVCHGGANNAMRLTPLQSGATNFTEDQSKTNFETVSRIVVPGKPMESHFLIHPLQPEFGGGLYHSGGRQFETTDDPDWKAMAAWVNGAK